MEKTIWYGIDEKGGCDVLEIINGSIKGNYHYGSYKQMRSAYKGQGFKFVRVDTEEE